MRSSKRFSLLRDQNREQVDDEPTTSGTRNNKLDRYFKYSLIKRKRDAFIDTNDKDNEEYTPDSDMSSTGDHRISDEDDTSSYARPSKQRRKI